MAVTTSNRPSKLTIAFLLFLFAIASGGLALTIAGKTPDDLVAFFFAAPEDGNWVAVAFDGESVGLKTYSILIKRGQIVSGYDGCNDWAYENKRPGQSATRSIITNLKECPGDALTRNYWASLAKPKFILLDESQLVVTGSAGRGDFRQCKPKGQRIDMPPDMISACRRSPHP